MSKKLLKHSSPYYQKLVSRVREKTEEHLNLKPGFLKNFEVEKIMKDYYYLHEYEQSETSHTCTCGKTGIKNLYWMKILPKYQKENEPILVGSECIKQFNDAKSVALIHLMEKGKELDTEELLENNFWLATFRITKTLMENV